MGVSGSGLSLAVGGGILLWAGLSGVTPESLVATMAKGQKPPAIKVGSPMHVMGEAIQELGIEVGAGVLKATTGTVGLSSDVTSSGLGLADYTGAANPSIASTALQYVGVPYVWGGSTPSGWDCSGFVTYVLKKLGYTNQTHITSEVYYSSSSLCSTIPTSQATAGDLVCWMTHIAIHIGNGNCVGAENPSRGTVTGPISQMGPGNGETYVIRRVKTGSTVSVA